MSPVEPDPAKLLGAAEILELQRAGERAARAGEPPGSCPYRQTATPLDRARRKMWIRGYAAGRTALREDS